VRQLVIKVMKTGNSSLRWTACSWRSTTWYLRSSV